MARKIYEIDTTNYQGSGLLARDSIKYRSGFYYDHELNNPLTRVTLHANKKYNAAKLSTAEGPWDKVTSDKDKDGYSLFPVATSIFAEDFSFDIANTFSNFGDDPIGQMWNSQAPMAPYAELVSDALKTISDKTKDYNENREGGKAKWADILAEVTNYMSEAADNRSNLLSRALHVKGTQFAYYSGSGISFNNMSMKFTLLSDWEGTTFKTVIDKLTGNDGWPLMAYVLGDYLPVTEIGKDGSSVKEFLSKYASWQLPPGGFRANLQDVDTINPGTLKLRFGPYFSIPNLVVSGCSISMSKEMMRNPSGLSPKIIPMSCDITLQFKPAANFSKATLDKILKGESTYIEETLTQKNFDSVNA